MNLSLIVPVLNSHEVVRRQFMHLRKLDLPDDVEIIYVDDGSDPPIGYPEHPVRNLRILQTHDTRPWTWALARNLGAREARGRNLMMLDVDYIPTANALGVSRTFIGDRMGFKRELGVLDENGELTQDINVLREYGVPQERGRKVRLPVHPNVFTMRADLFWELGGYRTDCIGRKYPQGEDNSFKKTWLRYVAEGRGVGAEEMPLLYMFPNGQFCGDVDANPFGLFHSLSRKTSRNPFWRK